MTGNGEPEPEGQRQEKPEAELPPAGHELSEPAGGSDSWPVVLIVLLCLVGATFAPLLAGRNFLPFDKYPNWGTAAARNAGRTFNPDKAFQARKATIPWVTESDFVSLSLYWPQDLLVAHALLEGRLPLWEPSRGGGYPTFDSGQFRPFNPFRIPFFAMPSNWMYSATLVLGLLFGAWGAFLWLKREAFSLHEALVGAGVFVLNPWVLERLVVLEPASMFFLPWLLFALHEARWENVRSMAVAALVLVAMAHSGQPEPCLLVTALASGHYLLCPSAPGTTGDGLIRRLRVLVVVGACTLAAIAILWVPLIRLSNVSFSYKQVGVPFLLESSWWAPLTLSADLFVAPALAGLLAVALLVWHRFPKYWGGVLLLGLLALMPLPWGGAHLKSVTQLAVFVIPLANFKLFFWAGLAFSVPSGLRAVKESGRVATVALVASLVLLLAELAWFWKLPLAPREQTAHPVLAFVALSLGPVALLLYARLPRRQWLCMAAAAALVLPMAVPLSLDHLSWNTLPNREGDLTPWLVRERQHERVVSPGLPFALPPDQGQAQGLKCVEINAAYFPNDYFHLFFQTPAPPTLIAFRTPELVRFRQMGATVMLMPAELAPRSRPPAQAGKWVTAFDVPGARGRLFLAEESALVTPGKELAPQIMDLGKGADGVAVVEAMGQKVPVEWPKTPPGEGRLSFLTDDPEEVIVTSEAPREALLVLRDTWYPGWEASVDGVRVPIYRANGCFRAVCVPPGTHEVRFIYGPALVYACGAVSLAATALLLSAVWLGRKRRGDGGSGTGTAIRPGAGRPAPGS